MNETTLHDVMVEQWMLQPVHSVNIDATVRDVLELMKRESLTSVPVTDVDGPLVGIVTLGDLTAVVLSTDQILDSDYPHYEDCLWAVDLILRRLGSDKVTEVMSENVASVSSSETMRTAAKLMTQENIHHLAVTSESTLVGMLSANDFVRLVAGG